MAVGGCLLLVAFVEACSLCCACCLLFVVVVGCLLRVLFSYLFVV